MPGVANKPIVLSVFYAKCRKYAHYVEYYYAECRYAECRGVLNICSYKWFIYALSPFCQLSRETLRKDGIVRGLYAGTGNIPEKLVRIIFRNIFKD